MSSRLIFELKEKLHKVDTTYEEKVQILTLLPTNVTAYKVAKIMNTTVYMVEKARDSKIRAGILSMPKKGKGVYCYIFYLFHYLFLFYYLKFYYYFIFTLQKKTLKII